MKQSASRDPLRVQIVSSAGKETSVAFLLPRLRDAISGDSRAEATLQLRRTGRLRRKLAAFLPTPGLVRRLRAVDVLIVHTFLVMCTAEILIARFLGLRICAIYWDTYPDSFRNPWGDRWAVTLWPMGLLETVLLRRCDVILPPSEDYRPALDRLGVADRIHTLEMWPFDDLRPVQPRETVSDTVRIVFAGQINPIRGLESACEALSKASSHGPIELHVFGTPTEGIPANQTESLKIIQHGRHPHESLSESLPDFDFGLVSLHPDFDCAVFPSKTLSYLAAGLPVLYLGPKLPAYERFLKETGCGVAPDADAMPDLAAERDRLRPALAEAQLRAIHRLEIDESDITAILGQRARPTVSPAAQTATASM